MMLENSLSPDSITDNLGTCFVGQRVIYYPQLASTMDVARQEAQKGAVEGTVIIADEQIAGKGRIKRIWLSPPGNLALSIILYPDVLYLPCIIMLASLAVAHSIEAVTGLKSQLKWPNDVLISDKKVCGILTESDVQNKAVAYVVIGIGINISMRPSDYPEILPTTTSLVHELGRDVSRVDMIRCLLSEVERLYLTLSIGDTVYEEWRDRLITLGKRVKVKSGEAMLEGIAESVDRDGSLMLRLSDGSSTRIVAGDVTLRDKT
ncbi:biotin--[acetyl-CoA-carboxylase] ligase [Chloroflexota bacterium]